MQVRTKGAAQALKIVGKLHRVLAGKDSHDAGILREIFDVAHLAQAGQGSCIPFPGILGYIKSLMNRPHVAHLHEQVKAHLTRAGQRSPVRFPDSPSSSSEIQSQ
ncbi:uncharacterized protein LOC143731170 [Siphateles boraxobius]|uniref:uncharacterized protein LOC143731170 n=1 Tax=Siphateles boraxobius TaxID=180520 RepID=UPI0040635210